MSFTALRCITICIYGMNACVFCVCACVFVCVQMMVGNKLSSTRRSVAKVPHVKILPRSSLRAKHIEVFSRERETEMNTYNTLASTTMVVR